MGVRDLAQQWSLAGAMLVSALKNKIKSTTKSTALYVGQYLPLVSIWTVWRKTLAMLSILALNSWLPCPSLLCAGITGMCHHIQLVTFVLKFNASELVSFYRQWEPCDLLPFLTCQKVHKFFSMTVAILSLAKCIPLACLGLSPLNKLPLMIPGWKQQQGTAFPANGPQHLTNPLAKLIPR